MQEGGYRLQTEYSKVESRVPTVSIITVVYNSELFIERTIQSVLNQDFPNIEHLIIDGDSKDETIAIIKSYDSKIAYWVSSKDEGIYDAMNKGLMLATGDYVLFLNSGDELYSTDIFSAIFQKGPLADVYYGDTLIVDEKGLALSKRRLRPPANLTYKSLQMGMVVCHQSLIVKRSISVHYNTNYKISADIDWAIRCLTNATKVVNTGLYIAKFMEGGMSQVNLKKGLIERFEILSNHFGLIRNLGNHFKIAIRLAKTFVLGR